MNTTDTSDRHVDEAGEPTSDGATAPGQLQFTPSSLIAMFGPKLEGLRQPFANGQTCRLHVFDVATGSSTVIADFHGAHFEAPNWSIDGETLYLNGEGDLWAVALQSPTDPRRLAFDVPVLNNDHVLAPDGSAIYASAMDGHIYRCELDGAGSARVTDEDDVWHFLHGISPDGGTLGFVRLNGDGGAARLALIGSAGGPVTVVDTGDGSIDGPEWSPDGEWIYFNTERWASKPGHAQLARVPSTALTADRVERLNWTETVDWFPHLSPDGRLAVYLQFPEGTVGHPENQEVEIVLVDTTDWTTPLARVPLFGGQGTMNVNSWAPDSTRFAFMSFPTSTPTGQESNQ
jgi:Tol biopolymer transport system component